MRYYWLLEYNNKLGWTAFESDKNECQLIISDSENEDTFACSTRHDLSDYEVMYRLDIVNPEALRSFEINYFYLSDTPPFRIYINNSGACS